MYKDKRGYLLFPIKNDAYMNKSPNISKDCTYSVNKKNVFRGLHINSFGKLITCITGHFIDIMVNMQTFDVKYYDIKPGDQIYCPPHFAHGFVSLEDNSVLSYHCEGYFESDVGGLLNLRDPYINIQLEVPFSDLILNEKDYSAPCLDFEYFLLGANGFIGSHILSELQYQNKKVLPLKYRMEDINKIEELIKFYKPKYFINAAGLTGTPNIKWCDTHQKETLQTNVISQINILRICNENNVHCTLIGSGAIFGINLENKSSFDEGTDKTTYYSECRLLLEKLIKTYDNYLLLRINYPISCKANSKNLITKVLGFKTIDNVIISVTNLNYMVPLLIEILNSESKVKTQGVLNFTNQGQICLVDLLGAYKYHKKLDKETFNDVIISDKSRMEPKLLVDELEEFNVKSIYETLGYTMANYE